MSKKKAMFTKIDAYLHRAYTLLIIIYTLISIAALAGGGYAIWLNRDRWSGADIFWGILILIGALLVIALGWIFASLFISYFVDIKLIRNKMYDVEDEELTSMFD